MEQTTQKTVWTIGAQLAMFALGLLIVFLIVWAASKGWSKGQKDSGYLAMGGDWLAQPVNGNQDNGYLATGGDWLTQRVN